MKIREEQPRDHIATLDQGPSSTSRNTHNNIFELFRKAKSRPRPQQKEDANFLMKALFIPERRSKFDNLENHRSSSGDH